MILAAMVMGLVRPPKVPGVTTASDGEIEEVIARALQWPASSICTQVRPWPDGPDEIRSFLIKRIQPCQLDLIALRERSKTQVVAPWFPFDGRLETSRPGVSKVTLTGFCNHYIDRAKEMAVQTIRIRPRNGYDFWWYTEATGNGFPFKHAIRLRSLSGEVLQIWGAFPWPLLNGRLEASWTGISKVNFSGCNHSRYRGPEMPFQTIGFGPGGG